MTTPIVETLLAKGVTVLLGQSAEVSSKRPKVLSCG